MEELKLALRPDLSKYDLRISSNAVKQSLSRWHDQAIAGAVLLIGIAALRSWILPLPWQTAAWIAAILGMLGGIGSGRAVRARLAFHSSDGPLAAEALSIRARRRYAATCHLAVLALSAIILMLVRPSLLAFALGGYLAGTLVAHALPLPDRRPDRPNRSRRHLERTTVSWLQRPRTGIWAAAVLFAALSVLSQFILAQDAVLAVVGIVAAVLVLALTSVDDQVVRFLAAAGYGPWKSVWLHMRGLALFLAISVPACTLSFGVAAGGVVTAVGLGGLLLLVLRVFAYGVHAKRPAHLRLSMAAGTLALVASFMPVLLPAIFALIFWQMQRQASRRVWLIQ